jgi:hypothetical protein
MPVPDTAAVQLVDGIDENTERGEPCERNDHINCGFFLLATRYHRAQRIRHTWPREEARRERYQPYETE